MNSATYTTLLHDMEHVANHIEIYDEDVQRLKRELAAVKDELKAARGLRRRYRLAYAKMDIAIGFADGKAILRDRLNRMTRLRFQSPVRFK